MSAAWEMADLVARWVHVIAGIMWVGNSLLFNWLDRNLIEGPSRATDPSLRSGQVWLLHSGGFYYVEKTLLPGQKLPVPLHWFKWQAYTTWLTGLALLVIVYWAGGRAAMGAGGDHADAVAIGAGLILTGWAVYELANRFIARRVPALSLVVWIGALILISLVLLDRLDPRAAYLHVGAMLGTIMAGNVLLTIVPSQRRLVASVDQGRQVQAVADSALAKRVSIHNNYFTFPVIVLMASGHFPSLYGAREAWPIMLTLIAGGVAVRHILNARYSLRYWQAILTAVIVTTVLVVFTLQGRPWPEQDVAVTEPETFEGTRRIIDRRCAACHSATPSDLSFGVAPGGVMFDTPEQIAARANRINERAVVTRTMPPANKTNMTEAERVALRRWIAAGAPIR